MGDWRALTRAQTIRRQLDSLSGFLVFFVLEKLASDSVML